MSDFENQKNKGLPSAASPKARKFARELGVNINLVSGSERAVSYTHLTLPTTPYV